MTGECSPVCQDNEESVLKGITEFQEAAKHEGFTSGNYEAEDSLFSSVLDDFVPLIPV